MKVQILDVEALRAITPAALSAYARTEGWRKVETYGEYSDIYVGEGRPELVIPRTSQLADYASVVSKLIALYARAADVDDIALYRDLVGADHDVIRVRAVGAEDDGSVAIDAGVDIVAQSRDMLLAAACSAHSPQRHYRAGANKEAIDYMRRVRLGQTERGSFVVTLLAPASPQLQMANLQLWPDIDDEPYERKVTRMLVDGLRASKSAAEAATAGPGSSAFDPLVGRGMSANLCEAVAGLIEQSDGLDISLTWARTRPVPQPRNKVTFARGDAMILREVARTFRSRESRPDQVLLAYVRVLTRERADADGTVTLQTLIDGKQQSVKVELSREDYELAMKAHAGKDAVVAKGDLARVGQRWWLEAPSLEIFSLDVG